MRYGELTRFIRALERSGGDANVLRVERALKIAIPITCLVIALFGAPLATSTQRGGAAYGIGVSLATTIIFLLMIQLTKAIGGKAIITPDVAAWLPNAMFAVGGTRAARARPHVSDFDRPFDGRLQPTETFPVVQRTGIKFFRRITRAFIALLPRRSARAGTSCATSGARSAIPPPSSRRRSGRCSASAWTRSRSRSSSPPSSAASSRSRCATSSFPGVQLSIIGLSVRLMQVLELGPLLTGLVLTGRVGARMTAEIGTMRVTEQIDALETLSYDPAGVPHRAAAARGHRDAPLPRRAGRRDGAVQRLPRVGVRHRT